MEYLNEFHKTSTEKAQKALAEQRKNPISSEEACKKAFEMHKELAKAYPSQSKGN